MKREKKMIRKVSIDVHIFYVYYIKLQESKKIWSTIQEKHPPTNIYIFTSFVHIMKGRDWSTSRLNSVLHILNEGYIHYMMIFFSLVANEINYGINSFQFTVVAALQHILWRKSDMLQLENEHFFGTAFFFVSSSFFSFSFMNSWSEKFFFHIHQLLDYCWSDRM